MVRKVLLMVPKDASLLNWKVEKVFFDYFRSNADEKLESSNKKNESRTVTK